MLGVSEVIAIILILMITISLAGLAYMFMSTTMSGVTASASSTVDTTTSSMLTSFRIESINIAKVYIRNTGQNALSSLSVYVNDEPAIFNATMPIAAGTVGTIIIYSFIPDGATVKVTSPSGFSVSKTADECSKAVGCWKFDEADREVDSIVIWDGETVGVITKSGGGSGSISLGNENSAGVFPVLSGTQSFGQLNRAYASNQDWSSKSLFRFSEMGFGTNAVRKVWVLAPDWSNYFTYTFTDNWVGMKQFNIPFSSFSVSAGAPSWASVRYVHFVFESLVGIIGQSLQIGRIFVDVSVPAMDSSGNGNTGIPINGASLTTGKFGNGLLFDGVNDYVSIGNASVLNPTSAITLSAWVKMSSDVDQSMVRKDGAYLIKSYSSASGFSFVFWNASNPSQSIATNSYLKGTDFDWHYVVGTYDSATGISRIYIDGILSNTNTYPDKPSIAYTTNALNIGSLAGNQQFFNGAIDEVRIYNRAIY